MNARALIRQQAN